VTFSIRLFLEANMIHFCVFQEQQWSLQHPAAFVASPRLLTAFPLKRRTLDVPTRPQKSEPQESHLTFPTFIYFHELV